MTASTNRCPICDENILMPFRKRLSETQFDHVVVCANQHCKATFRLLPQKSMQLVSCDDPGALTRYPAPLDFDAWLRIWQITHARRSQA
jgi:hypothetical protein